MRLTVLGVLLLALAGDAAAATAFRLETGDPVHVDGALEVSSSAATLAIDAKEAAGRIVLVGFEGTLEHWTWERRDTHVRDTNLVEGRDGDANGTTLRLENATITVRLRGEALSLRLVMRDLAAFSLAGRTSAAGRPVVLDADVAPQVSTERPLLPGRAAPRLDWRFPAGDSFYGLYAGLEGHPPLSSPRLEASGPLSAEIEGGLLEVDAGGEVRRFDLRSTREDEAGVPGVGTTGRSRTARVLLEGGAASVKVPLADAWGLSASRPVWSVDGSIVWTGASGEGTTDGRTEEFADATVEAVGRFEVAASRASLPVRDDYRGHGDLRAFVVDGRDVAARATAVEGVREVGVLAGLALALGLAAKAAAAAYTRTHASRALEHPMRRRIFEAVQDDPGIHKSELHRHLGGAWGPFSFHVHRLVTTGHLVCRREAGHDLLFVAGTPAGSPVLSPMTRRVYAAVPSAPGIPVAELAARLAVTRPRLRYHVSKLERRGLVAVEPREGGLFIARAADPGGEPP